MYQEILKDYSIFLQAASLEPNDLDLSSSEDEQTKVSNGKIVHSKSALKPKLSNSSSKSGDEGSLHFDLPEHLKATITTNNATIIEEDENVAGAKKQKKSKKSKEKKHHKKRKSIDKERDDLEEFLNGIPPPTDEGRQQGAYEEL